MNDILSQSHRLVLDVDTGRVDGSFLLRHSNLLSDSLTILVADYRDLCDWLGGDLRAARAGGGTGNVIDSRKLAGVFVDTSDDRRVKGANEGRCCNPLACPCRDAWNHGTCSHCVRKMRFYLDCKVKGFPGESKNDALTLEVVRCLGENETVR